MRLFKIKKEVKKLCSTCLFAAILLKVIRVSLLIHIRNYYKVTKERLSVLNAADDSSRLKKGFNEKQVQ